MSFNSFRRLVVAGVALSALTLSATASAAKLHGVVVQHNQRAHSLQLVLRGGRLVSVHTRRAVRPGRVVTVSARRLLNGTFALSHLRTTHRMKRSVRIRGVVTFVNHRHTEFTVSGGGASLLVRTGHRRSTTAVASAAAPAVGERVSVRAHIDDQGDLEGQGVQDEGTDTTGIRLEGTVLAIDTTARTITVSADDEDESGQSVTVVVPAAFDISMMAVGDQVELTVSLQPDGTYLLLGSSGDESADQADDSGDQQGCQGDDSSGGCSVGGSDGSDAGGSSGSDG